jgi:hypothetical protein
VVIPDRRCLGRNRVSHPIRTRARVAHEAYLVLTRYCLGRSNTVGFTALGTLCEVAKFVNVYAVPRN